MSVDSKHPRYSEFLWDWLVMRDTFGGERCVKERSFLYLPPTEGMIEDGALDGSPLVGSTAGTQGYGVSGGFGFGLSWGHWRDAQPGWRRYQNYLRRAVFYDFVSDAVKAAVGVMHHKPAVIELPPALEPLRDKATINGESLQILLRKIHEEQLVAGRLGLLLDFPVQPDPASPLPYFVVYPAEQCINWDDGARDEVSLPKLNLVVLDESEDERDAFEWRRVEKWRVLVLGDFEANEQGPAPYRAGVFRERGASFSAEALREPQIRGRTLDELPFTFINAQDLVADPDRPPLMGLANLCLAIYRGDADYRLGLFQQSNATLVISGGNPSEESQDGTIRTGPGGAIELVQGGDAKYIVAPGDGLKAQREALSDDKMQAAAQAGSLIDTRSGQKEGAETLRIRVRAQTASLNQIALAGAAGIEHLLKVAARWVGADPDRVSVVPNLDFDGAQMTGEELMKLVTAKSLGAPLSRKSIHHLMRQGELTQLEFEEEAAELEGEEELTGTGEPEPEPAPAEE